MKLLAALCLAFCLSNNSLAAAVYPDTSIPKKPYQISHQQFLDKYENDEVAKAVINYFFKQHKKAAKRFLPYLLLTGAGTIIYATAIAGGPAGVVILLGSVVLLATFISGILFLDSCITLLKFSRKRLLKVLNNYYSGKGLPRHFSLHEKQSIF